MRFAVLGPLHVTVGERTVDLASAKQRRLLIALLIDAGRVVSTGQLIDALWGEDPPATALESLRTYVYRVRSRLGDDGTRLQTRPPGYLLQVDRDEVDAGRFEALIAQARHHGVAPNDRLDRLDEGLGLWRGRAFGEFADDDLARAEAIRLEELARTATEERFEAMLALGRHTEAVGEVEAFVANHPFRERARRHLMLALYRCGRQADALAVYHDLRRRLDEELGLEVPASLRDLELDILQQSPSLDPPTNSEGSKRTEGSLGDRPVLVEATGPDDRTADQLPVEATPLIGREADLAALEASVKDAPLVSIVGPGGVGKSRLALRHARNLALSQPDGVWWCELAPVDDEGDVAEVVATTLGVRPGEDATVADAVVTLLRDRQGLLVLDNCEHVLGEAAALAQRIGRACPSVSILATSRRPLGVPMEYLHRLGPLAVLDPGAGHAGPALELFVERGRAVRANLDVEAEDDFAAMVSICRLLDGLPLALELAASRLRALNPIDLAARLTDRLDLLEDPQQGTERHRALRQTLEWSYSLLGKVEQRLFDRLSVFAGPFTLEAAEEVAAGGDIAQDEMLDLLAQLVDHSLVVLHPGGGISRYTLLKTLRTYGRERLRERGEEETFRRRHAAYFVSLSEDASTQVRGRDEAAGVVRLNRNLENLRAAHRWSVQQGEADLAVRLVTSLLRYAIWRLRDEVLGWAAEAAALPSARSHERFPTLAGMAGWAAGLRGDLAEATVWADRGLAVLDNLDDPRALVPYEVHIHIALWSGNLDSCLDLAERARAMVDDPVELVPHYVPGLALTYGGRPSETLAWMEPVQAAADRAGNPTMRSLANYTRGEALLALDPPEAILPLEQAAELAQSVDNRVVLGVVDVSLATLHARHGDPKKALQAFTSIIARLYEGGDWTHLWTGLRSLVSVLARLDLAEDAAVLLGAVREAETAPPPYGEDAGRLAELAAALARRLGDTAYREMYARGRAMTDHDAVTFAELAIERASESPV